MNCKEAKSLVGRFYDEELNSAERDLMAQHLERCRCCDNDLAALAKLDRCSRRLISPEPSPALWNRIAEQLAASDAGPTVGKRLFIRRHLMGAAAVLAASVVGGLLASVFRRRRGSNAAAAVQKISNDSGQTDPMVVNLSLLGPEDRRLVESQRICAADDCHVRLGAEGPPVKIVLQGTPLFVCCHECELRARAHPKEALAKLQMLEQRHPSGAGTPPR
jgi:hypothetical protein